MAPLASLYCVVVALLFGLGTIAGMADDDTKPPYYYLAVGIFAVAWPLLFATGCLLWLVGQLMLAGEKRTP